ncbi:MAG: hypothetical protein IPP46_19255 [Bacteroidetes bacterium]|nr:hypothetical protein [Bacteroidota bacterium]
MSIHSPAIRREETAKVKKLVRKEKKSRQGWRLMELIPAAAVLALLVFNPRIIQQLNTGFGRNNSRKRNLSSTGSALSGCYGRFDFN